MMFSLLSRWQRKGMRSDAGASGRRSCRTAFRPRLEALEDRCVPSTLTVTNADDDVTETHTLRWAVANAVSGDTILLTAAVKSPIVLTQGELVLSDNVTIESVPARTPTISGDGISRVFEISAGVTVSLMNLNIIDGNGVADNSSGTAAFDGSGGAILNFGTLTVISSTLSWNSAAIFNAGSGGAIFNAGTLTVTGGSTLSDNAGFIGFGGAIFNAGTATVMGSTLSGNSANGDGGGIYNDSGGTLAISQCFVVNNSATGNGGGIFNNAAGGAVTVSDSTFCGNTPDNIFGPFTDLGGNTFC